MINNNNEINNILKLYKDKIISEYDMSNMSDADKYNILYFLLIKIKYNSANENKNKNYKLEYYYDLFEYLINKYFQIFIENRDLVLLLFTKLTILKKGHLLINKFIFAIDDIKLLNIEIKDLLLIASLHGALPTFILWLKIYNVYSNFITDNRINMISNLSHELNNDILTNKILINAIANSDDRIYKYLLGMDNIDIILNVNEVLPLSLINSLGTTNIPTKYKLKRLKLLSEKVNLNQYFFEIIKKFSDSQSIYLLHKYYYTDTDNIYTISSINDLLLSFEFIPFEYLKFYNILKTNTEKILFIILCSLKFNYYNKIDYDKKLFETMIINNSDYIINFLFLHISYDWKLLINNIDNNLNGQILKILCNHNLIGKYIENYTSINYTHNLNYNILKFTKFLSIRDKRILIYKYAILNNKILHNLRLYVKRKRNNKFLFHKYKTLEIINSINNIKSNDNIVIFKNNLYQIINLQHYNKNKFQNIFIDNNIDNNFNFIPYNHYPQYELLNLYNTIDADYDEDNDLYIINDINIPNTTFVDRYLMLLQYHEFTSFKSINTISNINEFNNLLIKYNEELNEFKKQNNLIKWFPNFICLMI